VVVIGNDHGHDVDETDEPNRRRPGSDCKQYCIYYFYMLLCFLPFLLEEITKSIVIIHYTLSIDFIILFILYRSQNISIDQL
jgi:hypothetical protein